MRGLNIIKENELQHQSDSKLLTNKNH